jgi:hypothetical protein
MLYDLLLQPELEICTCCVSDIEITCSTDSSVLLSLPSVYRKFRIASADAADSNEVGLSLALHSARNFGFFLNIWK